MSGSDCFERGFAVGVGEDPVHLRRFNKVDDARPGLGSQYMVSPLNPPPCKKSDPSSSVHRMEGGVSVAHKNLEIRDVEIHTRKRKMHRIRRQTGWCQTGAREFDRVQ